MVSDFISDHRVLHVSLTCMRAHPVRKLINFRSLNRINEGSLVLDLDNIDISSECTDVNVLVKQYDDSLSRILDKHAPLKRMYVVERPMNDWITDNILALKKSDVNMSPFGVGLDLLFTLICIRKVVKL